MKEKLRDRVLTIEEAIAIQKQTAHKIFKLNSLDNKYCNILCAYKKLGTSIAIVLADFKCEKCGKNDITLHHLILRKNQKYMNKVKYFIQRHYFADITILCITCHMEFHDSLPLSGNLDEAILPISKQRIERIKNMFGISDKI